MSRAIEQNKSPEEQNAEEMSDDEFIKYLLANSKVRAEELAKENEMSVGVEASGDEIESSANVVKNENKIKYDVCFNRPNNFRPKEIKFDDVDDYDFSKGFTEFLISEEYVHLYFDFDSIKSEDEFLNVFDWLEKLKDVFGPFSYGGYCDNDEMEAMGFRRFDEGGHYLSMHVVFYETCISTVDLQKIMKHTEKKGYSTKGVHELCDPNVYKLVSKKEGQTTRQLFRHVLSDKIYKVGDEKNKLNHGFICEDMKPSTQIVQVRGNEKVIKADEWKKLFEISEKIEEKERVKTTTTKMNEGNEKANEGKGNAAADDLNVNDELIILSSDEMNELLNEFEPTYEVFTSVVSNLMHSPYEIEDVREWIERWYFSGEHHNQDTIELY